MATKDEKTSAPGPAVDVIVTGKPVGTPTEGDSQTIVFKSTRDAGPGGNTDPDPQPVDEAAKEALADMAKGAGVSAAGLQDVAVAAFLHQGWVPESEALDQYANPVNNPVDLSRSDLPGAVLEAKQAQQNKDSNK